MESGTIVLLNGPSSAGKTTIAKALQEMMEAPYLHTGIDHFLERFPGRYFVPSNGLNPASAEGWLLVFREQTPLSATSDGSEAPRAASDADAAHTQPATGAWIPEGVALAEVRIGPTGQRLLAGMYAACAAMARAGNHLIIDDVIYDRQVLTSAVEALYTLPVLFVGIHCPLEVVLRREQERGNRGAGGAAAFYHLVHAHGLYDLEIDSSLFSATACAQKIKLALKNGHPRTALRQLRERFAGNLEPTPD